MTTDISPSKIDVHHERACTFCTVAEDSLKKILSLLIHYPWTRKVTPSNQLRQNLVVHQCLQVNTAHHIKDVHCGGIFGMQ